MYDFVLPTPAPRFPKEDLESSLYIESVCTFILKCYYTPVTIYLMHQGPKQKSSHKFTYIFILNREFQHFIAFFDLSILNLV